MWPGGFAHSRAVLIAVDRYENGIPPLRTPVADATALGHLLHDQHGYQVDLLTDEAATLQGIRAFLEKLAKCVDPDDRVLFYFAGHGIAIDSNDGPRGYVLPQDASKDDTAEASFLPMVELDELLMAISCRHMLVILDCCFAGAMRWSSARHALFAQSQLHQERFRWYVEDPAWQALASAAHDQKALDVAGDRPLGKRDDAQAHSPFAAALIAGLKGAADLPTANGQGDGIITATELYLFIDGALRESTAGDVRTQRQMPILWPMRKHNKGQYVFQAPNTVVVLPPAPPLGAADNPWRGLESYHESHQQLFFGRAASIRKLAGRFGGDGGDPAAAGEQFLVVIGPSGIGKSSLVGAGLVPQLREQGYYPLHVRPGIPSSSPFANLAAALTQLPGDMPVSAEQLENDGHALAAWANRVREPVALIVDQAEELITVNPGGGQADGFLQLLDNALENSGLRVVMSLRSEYEPLFSQSPLSARWAAARFLVPRMTQDDIRRVIEAPAAVRVLRFESDELVDQLINDVIHMPGALPLLSFALSQMYIHYLQRRDDDRTLTRADYDSLEGGVTGALRMTANALVDGGDGVYGMTARRVLTRFVAIERGEYSRRRVPKWELTVVDADEQRRIDTLLQSLTRAALVISDSTPLDPGGLCGEGGQHAYYELAHDALILGWERLNDWIREDSAKISALRKLTQAAADWENAKRAQDGLLWTDQIRGRLAQQFSAEFTADTNTVEVRFVQASLRRQALNRRRGRVALAMVALMVVGLLSAVSAALVQFDNKQVALSLKLANVSGQLADKGDYARAGLVAAAALPQRQFAGFPEIVPEVETALYTAASNLLQRHVLSEHTASINAAQLCMDDAFLITGSSDKTVKLWSLEEGKRLWSVGLGDEVLAVSCDQHGTIRAATKAGGIVELALLDGAKKSVVTVDGRWTQAEFSPSGKSLVVVANSNARTKVVLLRGAGLEQRRLLEPGKEVTAYQWHAHDETLALSLRDSGVLLLDAENRARNFNAGKRRTGDVRFVEARQLLIVEDVNGYWEWRYTSADKPVFRALHQMGSLLAVSADQHLLATGHWDGCVRVWDMLRGEGMLAVTNTPCRGEDEYQLSPVAAQFISDGEIFVASQDRTASISRLLDGTPRQRFVAHNARIGKSLLALKRNLVVTISDYASEIHDIYVWGRQPLLMPRRLVVQKEGWISAVTMSGDGTMLAAAVKQGGARVWTLADQTSVAIAAPLEPLVVNFSRDSRHVVIRSEAEVAAWRLPGTLIYSGPSLESGLYAAWRQPSCILVPSLPRGHFDVIHLSDGHRSNLPPGGQGRLPDVAEAAPDCTKVAFTDTATLYVRNLASPSLNIALRLPETINALSWSPSGHQLFAMTDSFVYLINEGIPGVRGFKFETLAQLVFSNDGRVAALRNLSDWMTIDLAAISGGVVDKYSDPATPNAAHSDGVSDVQFSPDGKYIVTAGRDFTAKIWETSTGRHVRTFRGHGDYLSSASFSPDGKRLVTSAYMSEMELERQNPGISESMAMLWDVASGKPIAHLEKQGHSVISALFSHNGRTIYTTSLVEEDVRAWRVFESVEVLRDFVCAHIDTSLSPVEKLSLMGTEVSDEAGCGRKNTEK